MSSVELQYDASTPVSLTADRVATSASLAVVAPDGSALSAPAVTLPTVSTTTTSGTTADVLELASVSGIAPGDRLQVTSDGVAYNCTAAIVDATAKTVTLVTGLQVVPDLTSAVKNTKLTATVTAPGVANLGANWRLVWTYSDGTTTIDDSQPAAVVRQRWVSPITAADVRDVLAELGGERSELWCQGVADRVDSAIQATLEGTGRRPWLYLSSAVFTQPALLGIRYELAQRGITHGGQIYEAQRELRFARDDALAQVIGSLPYDANQDGAFTGDEVVPSFGVIQATR